MIFEGLLALLSSAFFMTSYVEENGFPKPLSKAKEAEYFKLAKEGDRDARNTLVTHNMRLVVHIAKKYVGIMDSDDLISVGAIGLLKAIDTFQYDKGTQFSTYAAKCIDNEILMTIRANKKNQACVSLYQTIGIDKEGNEITLIDTLYNDDNVAMKVEKQCVKEKLLEIIEKVLSEREYKIICMRYGLKELDVLPQREIAKKFSISRSYISRIEKKALQKLKEYMVSNDLDLR
ncbi:MAG: sigma-70 family RNA polymerase sigma factor [Clostridia bacterium]|nr:sigma-70 family RNA polymerase sigma factor [Clostridia bacterium]